MNRTRHYIRTLLVLLMMMGGGSEAWAVDVIYKVIDNSGYLAVTTGEVTLGDALELPETYRSALLELGDYIYYKNATQTGTDGYGTLWSVSDDDRYGVGEKPSENATVYVRYKQYDLDDPSKTGDDNTIATATMKARMKELGLLTNGFYNIKQGDYYMYKSLWSGQVNTYFGTRAQVNTAAGYTVDTSDDIMGWEFDFSDPYSIIIKSRFREEDIYLTVGTSFADVRIWNMTESRKQYFWSFILTKGGAAGTLRLMVGNDNFDRYRAEANKQTGQYLSRVNTTKTRYQKVNGALSDLTIVPIGTVRPTFRLVTHYGQRELRVTTDLQAIKSTITLPAALSRKFCTYRFYTCQKSDGTVNTDGDGNPVWEEVTIFPVMDNDEAPLDILVTYEVSSAGTALFNNTNYTTTGELSVSNYKSLLVNNSAVMANETNIAAGTGDDKQMLFRLLGDPYTVQVINYGKEYDEISSSKSRTGVSIASGSSTGQTAGFLQKTDLGSQVDITKDNANTYLGNISDPNTVNINVWEMVDVRNYLSDEFALRQFNTYDDPKYLGSNQPLQYQLSASRMRLVEASFRSYTYHIINRAGQEAISYTITQTEGTVLNYQNLPSDIRSPYIADEVLTFRSANTTNDADIIRVTPSTNADIYVRYTVNKIAEKAVKLDGSHAYNMKMSDDHYAIYNSGLSKTTDSSDEDADDLREQPYFWLLTNNDPYAVEITNLSSSTLLKYVAPSADPASLTLGESGTDTKFILMRSDDDPSNTIQLMAATGEDISTNDYYCIGLDGSNNITVRSKTDAPLGNSSIKLVFSSNLPTVHYYVIDLQNKIVLDAETDSQELEVPAEIRSPLVDKWQFWKSSDVTVDGVTGICTISGGATPVTNMAQAFASPFNIYATYKETGAVKSGYLATANPATTVELSRSTNDEGKTTITMGRDYNTITGYQNISMFRLKYLYGDSFYQEDAKDGFETTKTQAVYPYTNGDAEMYIYGEADWEDQLSKGASTRTRWPWYLVSYNATASACGDPYHVKVTSYQQTHTRNVTVGTTTTTTRYYNYFRTYYNTTRTKVVGSGTPESRIITTNVTDDPKVRLYNVVTNPEGSTALEGGSDDNVPTEYMILGTMGNFKLVTVNEIAEGAANPVTALGKRQTVNSFEQYWKTWETITKKGTVTFETNPDIQSRSDIKNNIYTYNNWVYARPVETANGETAGGNKRYKYEKHYYQTIDMGETFDLVEVSFAPVLVLLDKHGWEIMRKPIPMTGDDVSTRTNKVNAIKMFDSPMVKTYHWYTNASKVTGYHKYTPLTPEIIIYQKNGTKWEDSGDRYVHTSTSLSDLPYDRLSPEQGYGDDETSSAANDANKTDLYVTYDVKEEYANTYEAALLEADVVPQEYLLYQGGNAIGVHSSAANGYAKASGETTLGKESDATLYEKMELGDKAYFDGLAVKDKLLWYAKPNFYIDEEMGYDGDPIVYTLAQNGFDPYNVQIQSKAYNTYLTTNASSFSFDTDATWQCDYTGTATVKLEPMTDDPNGVFTAAGYDQVRLKVTNATFMVVSDDKGNMRLMPRFDHKKVLDTDFKTLLPQESWDVVPAKDRDFKQTVDFMRPVEFQYYIVDNDGYESLRYKGRLGQHEPDIPAHFKSPLATNFKYYGNAVEENDKFIIEESTATTTSEDEITSTFGAAGQLNDHTDVYVRYAYNETKDAAMRILQGNWLKMQLNKTDDAHFVKYDAGIVEDNGEKSGAVGPSDKPWQWKFLLSPKKNPDPYGVKVLNRSQEDLPMTVSTLAGGTLTALTDGTADTYQRFALLSHTADNTYALAVGGTKSNSDYYFISGSSRPAISQKEVSFSSINSTFDGTKSEIRLNDDVTHSYTYKVIRNDGQIAVTADETLVEAKAEGYIASLPSEAQTPLLNTSDYHYYAKVTNDTDAAPYTVDTDTEIPTLLGLYGQYSEEIYVRYKAYDEQKSPYLVSNRRNSTAATDISEASERVHPIDLSDNTIYNIIWAGDNMMYNNSDALAGANKHDLTNTTEYVWTFAGDDPYNIKLKNSGKSVYSVGLSTSVLSGDNATSFMLLKKDNYDYGILAVSNGKNATAVTPALDLLQNYNGNIATTAPTKFLIFALTTNLTYRLYFDEISKRYPERYIDYYVGAVGVGKQLEVPAAIGRPLCDYWFQVHNTAKDRTGANVLTTLPGNYFGKSEYVDIFYTPDADIFLTNAEAAKGAANEFVHKWRTLDTQGASPYRADFTYTRGTLAASTASDTHYTNDYLWTPEGDPYGFYLHNRYTKENGNGWGEVMTTASTPADGASLTMATSKTNAMYEMIYADASNPSSAYFKLHPRSGADGLYAYNNGSSITLSSSKSTNWTLKLSKGQLKPYFDRYGYIGGLNTAAYETKDENDNTKYLRDAFIDDSTPTDSQLKQAQKLCYDDGANTIKLYRTVARPDYYSIHDATSSRRYISGYTHYVEQLAGINLHYHEQASVQVPATYGELVSGTYQETAATRGNIPLEAALYDPASIFYFNPITSSQLTISTQGLYVNTEGTATKMSTLPENLYWMNIGGGIVMLRSGNDITTGYLAPDPIRTMTLAKGTDNELADNAKWCLQPVDNNLPLRLSTHAGKTRTDGATYYYATFYVPFDIVLPENSVAYICKQWDDNVIHLKNIGRYNTAANLCPSTYIGSDRFVPAGTPVLIRTTDASGYVDILLASPLGTLGEPRYPSTVTAAAIAKMNVFEGKYLEQYLGTGSTVYTFGQPRLDGLTLNTSTGEVTGSAAVDPSGVVGFYKNANPYKELDPLEANWTRNNWYMLHNKIYYRASEAPGASPAPKQNRAPEFIPVVFDDDDDDEQDEELKPDGTREVIGDGCVYDLMGRKVATREQVEDGSWKQRVATGIYIINGKKIRR